MPTTAAVSLVTDDAGRFTARIGGALSGLTLAVEKTGYEPSHLQVSWPGTASGETVRRDMRLYEIRRVPAGEPFEVAIVPDDPYCAPTFDDFGICRRVRVVAASAGVLRATADWPFYAYLNGGPAGAIRVAAGSETVIEVLLFGVPPQTTVVTTRLDPP